MATKEVMVKECHEILGKFQDNAMKEAGITREKFLLYFECFQTHDQVKKIYRFMTGLFYKSLNDLAEYLQIMSPVTWQTLKVTDNKAIELKLLRGRIFSVQEAWKNRPKKPRKSE